MFRKNFLAIELNENNWKVVIGRPNIDTNQVEIIHVSTYSDVKALKLALSKYSISHTIYCVNNKNGMTFVTRSLTPSSFESEKSIRSRSNNNSTQFYDYYNMGNSAVLVALPKSNVEEIATLHNALGLKCSFSIAHNDPINTYGYARNYAERSRMTAALINIQQDHASIIIVQYNTVKTVLFFNIAKDTNDTKLALEILKMLQGGSEYCDSVRPVQVPVDRSINNDGSEKSVAVEMPNLFTYDLVVFSGNVSIQFATDVRQHAGEHQLKIREVDVLDILYSKLININALSALETFNVESSNHTYAIPCNAVAMHCENLGVDLANKNSFGKSTPARPEVKIQQDITDKILINVTVLAREVAPALIHQKFIILLGVLLALGIAGYRYYDNNNNVVKLQNQYTAEKTKESSLVATKIIYDDLKRRNSLKNERIKAVEAIQKTQLLVPTIMRDIQGYMNESRFIDLITINQLSISGSEVKISGNALDKIKVGVFASILQQHNYEDVTPTRYVAIDAIQCTYEITTRYVGAIPVNPIINLPPQTQIQVAQQVTK